MSLPELDQNFFEEFFRKYSKKASVFLRGAKSKEDNYDSFRDTGYNQQNKNPLFVKILTKTISPSSLIFREMGSTEAGAIQGIIQNKDVELIKNSEKIIINNIEYYVYRDGVGGKFQLFPTQFTKFSKIILSHKDVG